MSTIVAETASADTVASKNAEAARITTQLDAMAERASILDEDYNQARVKATEADARARNAAADLAATTAKAQSAGDALKKLSVSAYMRGGLKQAAAPSLANDPTRAQYYLHAAANQQLDAIDQLKAARLSMSESQAGLAAARDEARRVLSQMNAKRRAAASAEDAQRALLANVKGDLARLVAAEQARRANAVSRPSASLKLAAPPAAPQAKPQGAAPRASRGAPAANVASPPASTAAAPNSGAAGALDTAKQQIGKPYHYGSAGPDSFDCSGLTSYAWRIGGGRSLPHSSKAQYSATSRVAMSDIAPGDLLFYGSSVGSIHHVGIYAGGGYMVDAPETGRNVQYVRAFRSDLVGIGRVN